jgi:hypothetical protein
MTSFEIRGEDPSEYLRVEVQGWQFPDNQEFWDGNWLETNIDASLGRFSGRVPAMLRTTDVHSFHEQLTDLYAALEGDARLETIEGWISLELRGDGLGHTAIRGSLMDHPGIGNRLSFSFSSDQTFMVDLLAALGEVVATFPIRGKQETEP